MIIGNTGVFFIKHIHLFRLIRRVPHSVIFSTSTASGIIRHLTLLEFSVMMHSF